MRNLQYDTLHAAPHPPLCVTYVARVNPFPWYTLNHTTQPTYSPTINSWSTGYDHPICYHDTDAVSHVSLLRVGRGRP